MGCIRAGRMDGVAHAACASPGSCTEICCWPAGNRLLMPAGLGCILSKGGALRKRDLRPPCKAIDGLITVNASS